MWVLVCDEFLEQKKVRGLCERRDKLKDSLNLITLYSPLPNSFSKAREVFIVQNMLSPVMLTLFIYILVQAVQ